MGWKLSHKRLSPVEFPLSLLLYANPGQEANPTPVLVRGPRGVGPLYEEHAADRLYDVIHILLKYPELLEHDAMQRCHDLAGSLPTGVVLFSVKDGEALWGASIFTTPYDVLALKTYLETSKVRTAGIYRQMHLGPGGVGAGWRFALWEHVTASVVASN